MVFDSKKIAQNVKLLVISFAFAPVVWQNSAVTLDYMWSLLFMLISFYAILNRRIVIAGIGLGIATGFRPSNLIAIIPLLSLLYFNKQGWKQIIKFCLIAGITSFCAFLPLMIKYGIPGWLIATYEEMSDVNPAMQIRFIAFFYRTIYFIGPITCIITSYIFWKKKSEILNSLRSHDSLVVISVIAIVSFLLMFLWLPLERAYLLPAFPFFLLVVDRFASQRMFALFTILLILSGLVNFDVINAEDRRTLNVNIHKGMVIEEFYNRKKLLDERKLIVSLAFPAKSIIMTSGGPDFWFENDLVKRAVDSSLQSKLFYTTGVYRLTQKKENPNILFISYLQRNEINFLRNEGFHIYCLKSREKRIESVVGYAMETMNIPLK